ncbi:MAG: hypothetical protein U0269_17555 [Polyangiales bacterium]
MSRAGGVLIGVGVALGACLDRPVTGVCPAVQSGVSEVVRNDEVEKIDLLIVVDNSGSMAENQANIMAQLGPLIDQLTNPRCISRDTPGGGVPHPCDRTNLDDIQQYPPVKDLHVGVVSTDLGTPGFSVLGCDDSERGDDGNMNPIRNGPALQTHLPWAPRRPNAVTAPAGFRPAACNNDPNQFPNFITFCSNAADISCDIAGTNASTRDPAVFADWFKCNAGLFINGCGLEQPLEATWRALVENDAREIPGNTSVNASFLRDDALLAIVMLSDEEDGSVRNCERDGGFSAQTGAACSDAKDVYNVDSRAWSHASNLDQRFYLYAPGGSQDPNWSLDRYVNTAPAGTANRWSRDLMSLKPGHPERIIFAAIAGVPLAVPMTGESINWNGLLGAPGAGGANDFYGRDSSMAVSGVQETAGPFSMRAANMDPMCSHVVPACRRQGSTYDAQLSCSNSQYMAFPSRRIVEIARRFDEAPLCNGQPCRNGFVTSICSRDFSAALRVVVQKISRRLSGKCLPRLLRVRQDSEGHNVVDCVVREILPEGRHDCDPARGRRAPSDVEDRVFIDEQGVRRTVCEIEQIPADATTHEPVAAAPGWFYDVRLDPWDPTCTQRISYTSRGAPSVGTTTRLECVQDVEAHDACGAQNGGP